MAASRRLIALAFLFQAEPSRSEAGRSFPHRSRRMQHQNLPSLLWLHRPCSIVLEVLVSVAVCVPGVLESRRPRTPTNRPTIAAAGTSE